MCAEQSYKDDGLVKRWMRSHDASPLCLLFVRGGKAMHAMLSACRCPGVVCQSSARGCQLLHSMTQFGCIGRVLPSMFQLRMLVGVADWGLMGSAL
jgi:hypothetical protein